MSFVIFFSSLLEGVVDELDLLLTAGRLSPYSHQVIGEAHSEQLARSSLDALRVAQKMMVSVPEFHTTNLFSPMGERPVAVRGRDSGAGYKAIIVLYMGGGADTFNRASPPQPPNASRSIHACSVFSSVYRCTTCHTRKHALCRIHRNVLLSIAMPLCHIRKPSNFLPSNLEISRPFL